MRRHILLFTLIGFSFLLAGCMNDQYSIERKYWYTKKAAGRIFMNPEATPPMELSRTVARLSAFSKKFSKTRLALDADFTIADLYVVKKDYQKARNYLQSMTGKYKSSPVICAEAVFLLGRTYEIDDQWQRALQQYKNIMRDYPATPRGLTVPFYIAAYYKSKYQPDKMMSAYQDAVLYFKELSQKYPNTPLSFRTDMSTAQAYMALKDYKSAADALEKVLDDYKGKLRLDSVLMSLATIYKRDLKETEKAKDCLKRIISDYPKGKLAKLSQVILKELDKPKSADKPQSTQKGKN